MNHHAWGVFPSGLTLPSDLSLPFKSNRGGRCFAASKTVTSPDRRPHPLPGKERKGKKDGTIDSFSFVLGAIGVTFLSLEIRYPDSALLKAPSFHLKGREEDG
jgi:hypothetical protein